MKIFSKSKLIDKKCVKSVIKERNLLAKINHPFIVNMHFSFQDNHYLYIILDLMKGGDLRYYIKLQEKSKKKFTEKEANFLVTNLILALEYIHKNNIIHCDIKPENILANKQGYFYLTDFSIAKNKTDKENNNININNINANINNKTNNNNNPYNNHYLEGSLGYMPPEILFSDSLNFCADYFSLGVICYEIMMGKIPYMSKNLDGMKKLVMANQVQIKKFSIPEGWSESAADFINKLIQRKQFKRLGYNGIEEIKNHPWIKDTNWKEIYLHNMKSPFIPELNKRNFYFNDKRRESQETSITLERYQIIELNKDYKNKFDEFYYFNKYSMKYKKENKNNGFINPHKKYEADNNKDDTDRINNTNNKHEKIKKVGKNNKRYNHYSPNKIK